MVAILPTTAELDAAMARASAAYAVRFPSARIRVFDRFEDWCRSYLALDGDLGPRISAHVIGIPDAKLLADAFDFAMRHMGSPMRAVRVGF